MKIFNDTTGNSELIYTECMSIKCPPWIIANKEKMTVRVDGRRTRNKSAKGMYMYYFLAHDETTGSNQHKIVILSINYTEAKPEKEKRIRINLPWNIWLKKNRNKLPYAVGDIDKQIK